MVVGVFGGLPPVHGLVRQADHQSIAVSEAASVAVLRKTENLRKPEIESPPAGDWRSHPLDCECPDCATPMPTYARAWSGA